MTLPFRSLLVAAAATALCQCSTPPPKNADVVVSVHDQKLGIYRNGTLVNSYRISTSKFGVGDKPGSCCTPLGQHEVVAKIGHGLPPGAVLKSRQWNGEVLPPNAPGRDPIVSRILWLDGKERSNHNAFNRFIYIHGTTEENRLGAPASYGCVRMAAKDVINVFNTVPVGACVVITNDPLPKGEHGTTTTIAKAATPAPASTTTPHVPKLVPVEAGPAKPAPTVVKKVEPSSNGTKRQRISLQVTS